MKAAVLNALGSPLAIETRPEPLLGTGEVIVDVAASRVLAYANEVLSGERKYLMELPMVPGPGAIGRIRATGPDATRLRPGDWVYCDPTVRCRDNARSPDIALQGLTGGTAVAVALGMGAQCVVATGRNEQALRELSQRFGARVRTVPMRGHEADDRARILQAAPGPIDCVLDILPPAANAVQVRTAVMAVRPY